jgi:acyl carrier protein
MNAELFDQLRTLAADVLRVSRSEIDNDSTPQQIENWDSIEHVNLLVAIEQQFGVDFDPDEMVQMESIGKIGEVLSRKIGVRA